MTPSLLERVLILVLLAVILSDDAAMATEPSQRPAAAVNILAGTRPEPKNFADVFGAAPEGWTDVDQLFELRRRPRFFESLQYDLGIRRSRLANWLDQDVAELYRRENPAKKPDFAFLFGAQGHGGYVAATMGKWLEGKLPGVELEKRVIGLALARLAAERPECPALAGGLGAQFDALCEQNVGPDDRRWWDLYARINRLREATNGLGVIGTLPASAQMLRDLFGQEFSPPPDLQNRLGQLLTRLNDATADPAQGGPAAENGLRKLSADALALRREVWLGLAPLGQYLAARKDLDLATEWQQQLAALYDELSKREWFAKVADQTFRRESLIFDSDRDPTDVVLRRTEALLSEIQSLPGDKPVELAGLGQRLASLHEAADKVPLDHVDARYAIYFETCRIRRQIAFANPLLDFKRILFIKRHFMPGEVNFPFFISQGWCALAGGGLFVLEDPFGPDAHPRDLLAGVQCQNGPAKDTGLVGGAFIGPELSFDANRILFSWTAVPPEHQAYIMGKDRPEVWTEYSWDPNRCYHVFSVNADGTGLAMLTDGPFNDVDPAFLPDGRILLASDRRGGFTRSRWWYLPGHTLHRMDADGGNMVRLSDHMNQEWQPSIDNNGMIVFTRYDYWDRGYTSGLTAWTMFPDGRDPRQLQGNYRGDKAMPGMEGDIRAVPSSNKLVATASPNVFGHTFGSLILIDPAVPDQPIPGTVHDRTSFLRLTPDQLIPYAEEDRSSGPVNYGTAWPLSDTFFLCAYDWNSGTYNGPGNNYGLYLIDAMGNKELLYRDKAISCISPIPMKVRPTPPVIPELCRPDMPAKGITRHKETGVFGLVNVNESLLEMPATKITALRIWQIVPRTTPIKDRPRTRLGENSGPRTCLGTVPVEADGSACFRVPADTPVYFQAIDAEGCSVQTMRAGTSIKPAERRFCQGCHEPRTRAPALRASYPIAFQRQPSDIEPEIEGSDPFNYARLVQPVLDRNCLACHQADPGGKAPDLSGDWRRDAERIPPSARSLWKYVSPLTVLAAGHLGQPDRTTPGLFGARPSKLYTMLSQGHHDLKLPPEDLRRLALWMDSGGAIFSFDRSLDRQAGGEIIEPVSEPENQTDVDRNYATGSMNSIGVHWLDDLKDYNGFERPITDAIDAVRPGPGFAILLADKSGPDGKAAYFRRAESYPLTGFLAVADKLRVEVSPAMRRAEHVTYLTLFQTLHNDAPQDSAALAAIEPLCIHFKPALKGWRTLDVSAGGKSGGPSLPALVATLGDGPDAEGVFCILEWPFEGGYVRITDEALVAGVKTDGLRLAPGEWATLPVVHLGFFTGGLAQAEAALGRLVAERGLFEFNKGGLIRSKMIMPDALTQRPLLGGAEAKARLLETGVAYGTRDEQPLLRRLFAEGWPGANHAAPAELLERRLQVLGAVKTAQDLLDQEPVDLATDEQRKAGWQILQFARPDGQEIVVLAVTGKGGELAVRPRDLQPGGQYRVVPQYAYRPQMTLGADLMDKGLPVRLNAGQAAAWRLEEQRQK